MRLARTAVVGLAALGCAAFIAAQAWPGDYRPPSAAQKPPATSQVSPPETSLAPPVNPSPSTEPSPSVNIEPAAGQAASPSVSQVEPPYEPVVHLVVPHILQMPEYPTGCEAVAVAQMIGMTHSEVTKQQVVDEMPRSGSDPEKGYVGDPTTWSGYTIYPPALMDLVRRHLGSAVDLSGTSQAELKRSLQAHKPVVVWIAHDRWVLHAITLTGYDDNLGVFFFNDPLGDADDTMGYDEFQERWDELGDRAISY